MKKLIFILTAVVCFACASQKHIEKEKTGRLGIKDSTQYELVVFDTGFESWKLMNNFRYGDYSNDFYASANLQFVQAWNRKYSSGDKRVNTYIDYSPGNDYGLEFNRELYLYFKYWEDSNRTKLYPGL